MAKTKKSSGKSSNKSATKDVFDQQIEKNNAENAKHDNRAPMVDSVIDETPRKLTTGGSFHDFKAEPVFEGVYTGNAITASQDDEKRKQKKGDVIGYEFISAEDDKTAIVGNSFSIRKAIEKVRAGAFMRIEFMGKVTNKAGQPFNQFEIDLIKYVKL